MKLITRGDLTARLQSDHRPVLLEALAAPQYQSGHLPGARWFPVEQAKKLAATTVPSKDTPVVVYCASETCRNSHVTAKVLVDLGYTDVSVYAGGKADWQTAGLPLERTPGIETTAEAVGCTLDQGGLLQRTAEFESLFHRALLRRDVTAGKATRTFAWSREIEDEVRALAASESSCCSFFRFDIARDGDELRWTVTVPASKADAIHMLDQLAVAAHRT
jgi:rhodanese-related sulfurtransferase